MSSLLCAFLQGILQCALSGGCSRSNFWQRLFRAPLRRGFSVRFFSKIFPWDRSEGLFLRCLALAHSLRYFSCAFFERYFAGAFSVCAFARASVPSVFFCFFSVLALVGSVAGTVSVRFMAASSAGSSAGNESVGSVAGTVSVRFMAGAFSGHSFAEAFSVVFRRGFVLAWQGLTLSAGVFRALFSLIEATSEGLWQWHFPWTLSQGFFPCTHSQWPCALSQGFFRALSRFFARTVPCAFGKGSSVLRLAVLLSTL